MSADSRFTPRILGIICNWCCYGGADLCGVSRFSYPPYIRLIRVMCSARADLRHILEAFRSGADGMFVGGCHLDDCHYLTHGNYEALSMVRLAGGLLEHLGVNPRRLRIAWVSAGEGIRFANVMNEFGAEVKELGPLGRGEGLDPAELEARLAELIRLIPYLKLTLHDKLALHLRDDPAAYDRLYSPEEIARLLAEVPRYEIVADKCAACGICGKRCPADAIGGDRKTPRVIDQDKCLKCGNCLAVCPPRFGAVQRILATAG
ncbi:MAG: hydrogenase iron-sulfur subunit [Deltaproteobacteria bacterium]|nr:hydrogenase iron-sulfur subunit [Deltaproteobacteria bacterium]